MQATGIFPIMVLQMAAIGEESGALDHMLSKAAEFYEGEVDEATLARARELADEMLSNAVIEDVVNIEVVE